MRLASEDLRLRAALFRLVDVTPACRGFGDIARHLAEYAEQLDGAPAPVRSALRLSRTAVGRPLVGVVASRGVRHVARRFIVGESPRAALRALRGQWGRGIASSLDLLGEATVTSDEADLYAARCQQAIEVLGEACPRWPKRPLLETDGSGAIPRANVSVKVTALTALMRPQAPQLGLEDAANRLRPLLRRARDLGAHLHIDSESVDSLETTMQLALEVLGEQEFAAGPSVGLVLQAYLRDSPAQLHRLLEWAQQTPGRPPLCIRLVKGAYWDHEMTEARQHRWQSPVFESKRDCDRNFEALTRRLIDARGRVRPIIASHNLRSVSHAIAYNRASGGADSDLELQVLHGLGDDLARSLAAMKLRVRAYCPVGELVAGMAYLVRRLLENTSNEAFVRHQTTDTPLEELLAAP